MLTKIKGILYALHVVITRIFCTENNSGQIPVTMVTSLLLVYKKQFQARVTHRQYTKTHVTLSHLSYFLSGSVVTQISVNTPQSSVRHEPLPIVH